MTRLIDLNIPLPGNVARNFTKHFCQGTGCWNWTASTIKGYGQFGIRINGKSVNLRAHRLSCRLHYGSVPGDRDIHHKCENKLCVRPDHLEPVTELEHLSELTPTFLAYVNKRKTHCPCGLPLSGDNLIAYSSKHPEWRRCRACVKRNSEKSNSRRVNGKYVPVSLLRGDPSQTEGPRLRSGLS